MFCEWIINSPCEQELYNVTKWFYAVAQLKLISGISTLRPPWGNIKGGGGNSLMKAKYHISSNNRHLSINHLPWIITSPWRKYLKINNPLPWIIPPLPPLSFLLFSKADQWWFKLWCQGYWHWKLINESNLEHLKSPCSVYLIG